jgi:hypothetical protein
VPVHDAVEQRGVPRDIVGVELHALDGTSACGAEQFGLGVQFVASPCGEHDGRIADRHEPLRDGEADLAAPAE